LPFAVDAASLPALAALRGILVSGVDPLFLLFISP
jgi:hypothetical protein